MARIGDSESVRVGWRRLSSEDVQPPVVETLPYLELKLEHPDLEATGRRERFFPDAVPYGIDGEQRVFYWRPALVGEATEPSSLDPSAWRLACATTHGLAGVAANAASVPPLTSEDEGLVHAVVEGTIVGDATTVGLADCDVPDAAIVGLDADRLTLSVDDRTETVEAGSRRSVSLDPRQVTLADRDVATTTEPTLSVRFPGERTLHHPAPGASYRYFPSFGLDLDRVASPVTVPTTVDELDHESLARRLGVDLTERPYAERVLWEAFAHAAFDPHAEGTAEIAQLDSGTLTVEPSASYADRTASSSSS
jgi:hypothetical protein